MWRRKLMPLAEWTELQDRFGEFQMVMRAPPELAMFCKTAPGEDLAEIYITGPHLDVIEGFSPSGWEDSERPTGEGVALLVGSGDPWELLGVPLPRQSRD